MIVLLTMRFSIGSLLYTVATKPSASIENRRQLLAEYVASGKITSSSQLDLALDYLKAKAGDQKIDFAEFDKKIGVCFCLSPNELIKPINFFFV